MLKTICAVLLLLCQMALCEQRVLIGIVGGTGSGKTTLAAKIQREFPENSILINQDSYYKDLIHLPHSERMKVNFDHPNSLDFDMLAQHLVALRDGESIKQPIYSFHTHCRGQGTTHIEPAQIIIVEGILLFAVPQVRDLFDLKVFIDADDDIRILRRVERDINERGRKFNFVRDQYLATVKPMHDAFIAPSKQHADVIVPRGGHNHIALDMILAYLSDVFYPEQERQSRR